MNNDEKLQRWKKLAQKRARLLTEARQHCYILAKLAANTPQFYNPLVAAEAKRLRDHYLAT